MYLPGLHLRLGDRKPPGKEQRGWGCTFHRLPGYLDLGKCEMQRFHKTTADWYQQAHVERGSICFYK